MYHSEAIENAFEDIDRIVAEKSVCENCRHLIAGAICNTDKGDDIDNQIKCNF